MTKKKFQETEETISSSVLPEETEESSLYASEKVILVIDGENLAKNKEKLDPEGRYVSMDFQALANILVQDRECIGKYFVGKNTSTNVIKFHNALKSFGFKIEIPPKNVEIAKNWDDEKIIEILKEKDSKYDTIIIISGDKDYVNELTEMVNNGKMLEVAGFKDSTSSELFSLGKFIDLYEIRNKIIRSTKPMLKPSQKDTKLTAELSISGSLPLDQITKVMDIITEFIDNDIWSSTIKIIHKIELDNHRKE